MRLNLRDQQDIDAPHHGRRTPSASECRAAALSQSEAKASARWMKVESMRQRPMRTWMVIMWLLMAMGMAACRGVRSGTAASFTAAFDGHHAGMAAVLEGREPAARPSQQMHADAALEERLPGDVRLVAASAVAAVD